MAEAERGRELVRAIIRAVEEDRELRYMLLGALGFTELLERFARLEERQQRLEERFAELEKRFAELEERFARLEERYQRLEERFARLEEEFKKLAERQQRLEERFARLEERMIQLERTVMVVAHRFGVISEEAFRQAMRYVVEEKLGAARVERWVYRDEEGLVYGHPALVEVDVVVRDGEHILLEIKSRVSKADVGEMYRVAMLYRRVTGREAEPVIVGGFVDPDAKELADRVGVRIIPVVGV